VSKRGDAYSPHPGWQSVGALRFVHESGAGVHRFEIPSRRGYGNWRIQCRIDLDLIARVRAARSGSGPSSPS
jgi:hypothetical protein